MYKRSNLNFLILYILLYLTSCNDRPEYRIYSTQESIQKVLVDSSSKSINISEGRQFFYKIFSASPEGLFCGYNSKLRTLDFFDIHSGRELNQAKLQTVGINKISDISGCYFNSIDSIFLLTENNIFIVDSTGKINSSFRINDKSEESFFKKNNIIEYETSYNFVYDKNHSKLYATNVSLKGMSNLKDFYNSPLMEMEFTGDKQIVEPPISWSELYKLKYFGYLNKPYFVIDNDKLIISYPIEPNIYVYNLANWKLNIYGGEPEISNYDNKKFIANELSYENRNIDDFKMVNYVRNVTNGKITVVGNGKFYIRSLSTALEKNEANDINAKKKYITIFDKDFKRIKTLSLNDRFYILESMFSTNQGLFIPAPAGNKTLRFKFMKFK